MIKAGKLRPIAVLAEKRLAEYPDVPTLAEAGFPGIGTLHWQSMLAPAATPKDVHRDPAQGAPPRPAGAGGAGGVQEAADQRHAERLADEAQAWLKAEIESWRKIISEVKIEMTE